MDRQTSILAGEPKPRATCAAASDFSGFLKAAYFVIGLATLICFLLPMRGGGNIASAATQASVGLVYGVAALIFVFGIVVVSISLRKPGG